jgi:ATP-dependent RNA helicase DeaD
VATDEAGAASTCRALTSSFTRICQVTRRSCSIARTVSILLVPPARKRRAELLRNLSGIAAIWGTAPQADEIRRLDHERMLQDATFTEETTSDDLILARALLAELSPEDIAAALARLYRMRLPSPEDILDPGQGSDQPPDDRGREKPTKVARR